jgi:diguanylate cyclase (GGDEF)-like protein
MFALPSVMVALDGSIPMMGVQAAIVVAGCTGVLAWAGLSGATLAVQVVAMMLATISPAVAVVLLRRRLDATVDRERELGATDPLTHAMNRRGLEAAIPDVVARSLGARLPVGLLVIDVDHFKQVNDRYGHRAGDAVLQRITALLQDCVRGGDLVCRLGGEEFGVLAVISPDHLAALGERIRRTVEDTAPYHVTVSVGAAWHQPWTSPDQDDTEQIWALLDRADELMYAAKDHGRNRMHIATSA